MQGWVDQRRSASTKMLGITLTPAYGRDYNSKDAVIADWNDGKDFVIASANHPYCGSYCSIRDFPNHSGIKLRYSKLRKAVTI